MTLITSHESAAHPQQHRTKGQAPLALILRLVDARARHDVDAALACYEPDAIVVDQYGRTNTGAAAIKAFIETVMILPLVFTHRSIVQAHDVAIHYSQWTIALPDDGSGATELTGRTTDVLRKQPGGSWLIAIDNPYGTAILQTAPNL